MDLVIEGADKATTIISGADVHSSWTSVGAGIYYCAWTNNFGTITNWWTSFGYDRGFAGNRGVGLRREMAWVTDVSTGNVYNLLQYLDYTSFAAGADGFYVDEAADRFYIRTPFTFDDANDMVELGERQNCIRIDNGGHITLRNLTLEKSSGEMNTGGLHFYHSSDIILEDIASNKHNFSGFYADTCSPALVINSEFSDNGCKGFSYATSPIEDALLLYNVVADRNNFRYGKWFYLLGENVEYAWDSAGGFKILLTDGCELNTLSSSNGWGTGLWADFSNTEWAVKHITVLNSTAIGIFLEASQGPISIDDAYVCNVRRADGNSDAGILWNNTSDATVVNSVFQKNATQQYQIVDFTRMVDGAYLSTPGTRCLIIASSSSATAANFLDAPAIRRGRRWRRRPTPTAHLTVTTAIRPLTRTGIIGPGVGR